MKFLDLVKVYIKSGNGGSGALSFRREKYIEKGLSFSIEDFGKSAPYKKVYDHFGLSSEKISKKIKFYIKK